MGLWIPRPTPRRLGESRGCSNTSVLNGEHRSKIGCGSAADSTWTWQWTMHERRAEIDQFTHDIPWDMQQNARRSNQARDITRPASRQEEDLQALAIFVLRVWKTSSTSPGKLNTTKYIKLKGSHPKELPSCLGCKDPLQCWNVWKCIDLDLLGHPGYYHPAASHSETWSRRSFSQRTTGSVVPGQLHSCERASLLL